MSKHTPEPWENFSELCEPYSANPDSDGFVRLDFYDYTRASSCVNACSGMRDPEKSIAKMREKIKQLDAFAGDRCDRVDDLWSQLCAAEEQRDKLLAALESLADVASSCDGLESFPRHALDAANSAMAEASK